MNSLDRILPCLVCIVSILCIYGIVKELAHTKR